MHIRQPKICSSGAISQDSFTSICAVGSRIHHDQHDMIQSTQLRVPTFLVPAESIIISESWLQVFWSWLHNRHKTSASCIWNAVFVARKFTCYRIIIFVNQTREPTQCICKRLLFTSYTTPSSQLSTIIPKPHVHIGARCRHTYIVDWARVDVHSRNMRRCKFACLWAL